MFPLSKFPVGKIFLLLFYFITEHNAATNPKISSEVQHQLDHGKTPNVIVDCPTLQSAETSTLIENLSERIRETSQNPLTTRSDIMTNLVNQYENTIALFLDPAIQVLNFLRVKHEMFWITSQIFVPNATQSVISHLSRIQIVSSVFLDSIIAQVEPQPQASPSQSTVPWNIDLINARCKNITCLGDKVIIGLIDTGALSTHVEIKDNWVGGDLGYLDGYSDSCTPIDDVGHGTYTTALTCGKNVGVAPNSKWMMCRNCLEDGCTLASSITCGQWLACPYNCSAQGTNNPKKDCSKRPHVINCSWGGTYSGTDSRVYYFFYEVIKMWNLLGIVSSFASGNEGPSCFTTGFPAGYDTVCDVGAVDSSVLVADFSSIGPAISTKPLTNESIALGTCSTKSCGGKTCSLIKPTVVAPGVDVISAFSAGNDSYAMGSGTSASAPHVTGVVALMICAKPEFKWNYKKVYDILTSTAETSRIDLLGKRQNKDNILAIQTNLLCNFVVSKICDAFPNNLYGFGLVNACKAVIASQNLKV